VEEQEVEEKVEEEEGKHISVPPIISTTARDRLMMSDPVSLKWSSKASNAARVRGSIPFTLVEQGTIPSARAKGIYLFIYF